MVYSIPLMPEWNDPFHSAGVDWTISFCLEGNDHSILVLFVSYCHQTFCLTVLFRNITTSYQMKRLIKIDMWKNAEQKRQKSKLGLSSAKVSSA